MTIYAFLSLVCSVLALSLGIVVFHQNPSSRLHRVFLYFSVCLAGWALVEFGYRSAGDYETALFWHRLDIFWAMVLPLMLHTVLIFTENTRFLALKRVRLLLYGPALAAIVTEICTDLISGPPVNQYWGWAYTVPAHPHIRYLVTFWSGAIGIISVALLIRYYLSASDDRRQGTFLLTSGLVFTYAAGYLSESVLPLLNIHVPGLSVQSYLVGGVLAGAAVWRYQIFRVNPGILADSILEAMVDGLLVVNPGLAVVRTNTAADQLFQRPPQILAGMHLGDLIQVEPSSPLFDVFDSGRMPVGLADVEADAVLADGTVCPVSISTGGIPKNKGFICLVRDITERRQAHYELNRMKQNLEELVTERTSELIKANKLLTSEIREHEQTEHELIRSRQRFQEIVELLPEIVFEMDLNGIITYANRQTFLLTGYTEEDYRQGFYALCLLTPDDRILAQQNIERIITGEELGANEYTAVRKDGSTFPVLIKSAPIIQNGNPIGLRGVFVDITERKKIENELMNYVQRFHDMLKNIKMLAIMIDVDGTIVFVNDYFLEITEWKREDLVGSPVVETLIPEEKRTASSGFFRRSDLPVYYEFEILTASGNRRLVNWNNTMLFDCDGNMTGMSSIGEDITEKRSLEHQFLQAQKMETVGRLAGGIAHDFNNLLTIIMGSAELGLLSTGTDSTAYEHLAEIKKTANRATELTRQLLTFSRRQITEPKQVNINHVLLEMDNMLRRLIGEHIELVVLPDDNLHMVLIDPGNLEQAITNLAVNARDAMPDGGTLTITTENLVFEDRVVTRETDMPAGTYATIRVIDTGTGIDPSIQDYLFEPFFTTKDRGKGTGLGLATSYSIITGTGGSIDVEYTSREGTCMQIVLPQHECTDKPVLPRRYSSDQAPAGTETLLVVEDEPSLNKLISHSLGKFGYRVLSAPNGEEAFRIGTDHGWENVDMLLTDVAMPRMGGRELMNKVHEQHPDLPVLYMSGYSDTVGVAEDISGNRCEHIQKPFTPAVLAVRVRTILDNIS